MATLLRIDYPKHIKNGKNEHRHAKQQLFLRDDLERKRKGDLSAKSPFSVYENTAKSELLYLAMLNLRY